MNYFSVSEENFEVYLLFLFISILATLIFKHVISFISFLQKSLNFLVSILYSISQCCISVVFLLSIDPIYKVEKERMNSLSGRFISIIRGNVYLDRSLPFRISPFLSSDNCRMNNWSLALRSISSFSSFLRALHPPSPPFPPPPLPLPPSPPSLLLSSHLSPPSSFLPDVSLRSLQFFSSDQWLNKSIGMRSQSQLLLLFILIPGKNLLPILFIFCNIFHIFSLYSRYSLINMECVILIYLHHSSSSSSLFLSLISSLILTHHPSLSSSHFSSFLHSFFFLYISFDHNSIYIVNK